jgi:methylase of polypeptide subunit release factors
MSFLDPFMKSAACPAHTTPLTAPANRPNCPNTLVEFGAGDGSPIISALLKVPAAPGRAIHAYEISPASAHLAAARAAKFGLAETYMVHNSCFWEGLKQTPCECIISNPPYLPAPGEDAAFDYQPASMCAL